MMEQTKVPPTSKPLSMKLFSTWEGERTAPHCIPRTCTFKLQSLKLTKPLDLESSNLTICASMSVGNFRRSLRTDEINPNSQGIAELDYCFSFQYPHYLKREENVLKLSLQRRKRYKNRTILGYKTVAIGLIDLSQVMQCPFDDALKLFAKGGGFQIAQVKVHQLTSIPHESIRNHSGENSSTEEEDPIFISDDDLDSEGEERGRSDRKKKPKLKDDMKIKKRINALFRKMRLNDDDDDAAVHPTDPVLPITPEAYSQTLGSILGLTDESAQSDSDSIGTLPKPRLRPYFDDDFDVEESHDHSPPEKGSSTDDGNIPKKKENLLQKFKRPSIQSPTVLVKSTRSASNCSTPNAKDSIIGDIRGEGTDYSRIDKSDESYQGEASRTSPSRQSPNSHLSNSDSGDAAGPAFSLSATKESRGFRSSSQDTEEYSISEQLTLLFNKQDSIPGDIILCFTKDTRNQHSLLKTIIHSPSSIPVYNKCVFIQNSSEAKIVISNLVSKMQKFVTRHSIISNVNLTIIGDFPSIHMVLKPLTDSLSNKGAEWIENFRFIFFPTDRNNPVCMYVSKLDAAYLQVLEYINNNDVTDLTRLVSYQAEVNSMTPISICRVLLTQITNNDQNDTKQFELPFIYSVSISLKKEGCTFCDAVDSNDDAEKCKDHEIDLLVDYSVPNRKDASTKPVQLKGIFRHCTVQRELCQSPDSFVVSASYREKKPKVALKLNKKCDLINVSCTVNNFSCMAKSSTLSSFSVFIDGVELPNITSFFLSPIWSQHLKYLPVSIKE